MLKPYPFLRQDTYAWCLSIGLPVLWVPFAILFPKEIALGLYNQSGIDIIGPFQGGGGGCCYSVPARWTPGMTVRIDWESGEASTDGFPGYEKWDKYLEWEKKIKASHRQHSKTVPVPDYNGQDVCGITVHFLPCDDVKVTTSCWSPRNANYPIKEPIRMKEPKVCPR
ncbi:hypothetical protein ABIE12_003423 [Serratia sp. 509]